MIAEKGVIHQFFMKTDPQQAYYLFVPEGEIRGIWVSVHGISINAKNHAEMLRPYAQRGGFVLLAPVFSKEHSPQYNLFGAADSGFRGDKRLLEILEEVSQRTGVCSERFFLMGYSAGGQFAHRFIMNYPEKIRAAVICSPGYFTFPDDAVPYPYGLQGMQDKTGREYNKEAFLSLPIFLNVGSQDVLRTANLLQGEDIDTQQGMNRVERAKKWFDELERQTGELHITADHRFAVLDGVGHGFETTMEKTPLGELALSFLLDHV